MKRKTKKPKCEACIITKYHGPTNTRGSKISAKCQRGKCSIPYDYGISSEDNHRKAAAGCAHVYTEVYQ